MGWGGKERRGPPRRAHLLCSAGNVCQAVGGRSAWSHQPTPGRNSPEKHPPCPRPTPPRGLLLVSLGRWCGKATFGNLKERGVWRTEKRDLIGFRLRLRCRDQGQWAGQAGSGRVWGRGSVPSGGSSEAGRGGRGPPGAVPCPASRGRRRGRSGDRALVPGCGKRPRSQPPETPPPPPHLVEEPGKAAWWGLGRRAPGVGTEGRRAEGRRLPGCGLLRGKGPRGVRRGSLCHRRGLRARGPWARSPEAEVAGGRGGGPTEVAAEAAGR